MVTLTVKIPTNEIDELRYACAMTDDSVYVHETIDDSHLVATVTMEVRSIASLFYLVRAFDQKVEIEKDKREIERMIERRNAHKLNKTQS